MASSPVKVEQRRLSRQDAAVTEKLSAAIGRIRTLELILGFAGILVGFLGYGQVMAAIDVYLPLPEVIRQLALFHFLGAVGFWGYLFIYRPLRHGINPYYAVLLVEENSPGTRNGLLNWLDIQNAPEGAAARGLVGQRAAKEVARVDLEKAIRGDTATWVSTAAAVLVLFGCILALLLGPRAFINSLHRIFLPGTFVNTSTTNSDLTLLRPEGGDGTILVGQAATVTVRIEGRIPKPTDRDAARLRYRHSPDEPWREQPLGPLDDEAIWEAVVPAREVENGIDYQVTAGNASTPIHRINVIAAPMIEKFQAKYFFRAYTGRKSEVSRQRDLKALRGTEVELTVDTNRKLVAESVKLELDIPSGRRMISGTVVADNPNAFTARFTLEETGTYRLHFASTRKDAYTDTTAYPLVATPDALPEVELTHPARDVQLPANGLLPLEGWASDDEGLMKLTLRLQVLGGAKLKPILYREMESFRQKHGTYPTFLKYREAIDLTKLADEMGRAWKPEVGQKIEYWLEAMDACDVPGPSRTVESKRYRVEIADIDPDAVGQAMQRQQAEKDRAEHEKKQDLANAQEDSARKEENDRKEKGETPQPGEQQGPGENANGMNNPNPMNPMNGMGEQNPEERQTLNEAERLKDALEKKNQEGKQPGQGKEENKDQGGESKQGGEGKENNAESKDGATGEQKDQAGQGKEQGKEQGNQKDRAGEGKEGGQAGMQENKPEGKEGQGGMGAEQAGESKPGEQGGEKKPGSGREQPQGMEKTAEGKPGGQQSQGGQGKEDNGQGREAGEQKNAPMSQKPGEGKQGGERSEQASPPTGKSEGGDGENKPGEPGNQNPKGPPQGATSKPGANARDLKDPKQARPEDVEALRKQPIEPGQAGGDATGKELERIQKEANDPKVREAARQALEERKQNAQEGGKPGENKPGDKGDMPGLGQGANPGNGGAAERKPGQEPGMAGEAGGKPEPGMGQQNGQKAEVKEGEGGMGGMPMMGENGPRGKEMGNPQPAGGMPGMGAEQPAPANPGGMGPGQMPDNAQPEKAQPAPPTELQLQKFKDAVTPDVLKDLRMSPEEFERFLKKYEQMAKRPGQARETVPGSQAGTGNLPALGSGNRPTTPGGPASPTGPGTIERPQAPPGYGEAYAEFLRRLSQPERP